MNVFDILGPVMISPSSSHTVGAAGIGKTTLAPLGAPAAKVDIFLHGSFVKTYKGHGTDKALIAGIMGMAIDDSWIHMAPELARKQGFEITITTGDTDGAHPNITKAILMDASGKIVSLLGSSIGGGNILVKGVNGMEVFIAGQYTTLIVLHRDAPGTIAAAAEVMADVGVSICNSRLSRQQKGEEAAMTTEIDGSFGPELNGRIKVLSDIFSSTML